MKLKITLCGLYDTKNNDRPLIRKELNKYDYDIRYIFHLTIKIPEKYASLTRTDHNTKFYLEGNAA